MVEERQPLQVLARLDMAEMAGMIPDVHPATPAWFTPELQEALLEAMVGAALPNSAQCLWCRHLSDVVEGIPGDSIEDRDHAFECRTRP